MKPSYVLYVAGAVGTFLFFILAVAGLFRPQRVNSHRAAIAIHFRHSPRVESVGAYFGIEFIDFYYILF